MGRPRASQQIRDFAALFADVVTANSSCPYDWVARTGDYSIFSLLARLATNVWELIRDNCWNAHSYPKTDIFYRHSVFLITFDFCQATRNYTAIKSNRYSYSPQREFILINDMRRFGIAEKEMNKFLESRGFSRVRVRTKYIVGYESWQMPS